MSWEEKAEIDRPDHINVYIKHFGTIPENYHVHHIDNNHDNNDPNNLIALPRSFHRNLHSDYYFYYNLATTGMMNKSILQSLLEYYSSRGYSLRKKFSKVLVEFLLLKCDLGLKVELPQAVIKAPQQQDSLLKRVRGALAPFHKQNDLLFGEGGIYDKLSPKQVRNCLKEVLKTTSELYSEIKKEST